MKLYITYRSSNNYLTKEYDMPLNWYAVKLFKSKFHFSSSYKENA